MDRSGPVCVCDPYVAAQKWMPFGYADAAAFMLSC
jgi:hypothetical protein